VVGWDSPVVYRPFVVAAFLHRIFPNLSSILGLGSGFCRVIVEGVEGGGRCVEVFDWYTREDHKDTSFGETLTYRCSYLVHTHCQENHKTAWGRNEVSCLPVA